MAHGSAGEDNPVALNVAPMVDIIFCLCIFFMCSFHFKQLEGKIESWLPKDKSTNVADEVVNPVVDEVRVLMSWDSATQTSVRSVGSTRYTDNADLVAAIRTGLERKRVVEPRANAIIDALPDVPWKDVINVLDLCKAAGIDHVELAGPMPAK